MVRVDKKGTEAAAYTMVAVVSRMGAVRPNPINFTADHPFLFMIRDKERGLTLFLGKVDQVSKVPDDVED